MALITVARSLAAEHRYGDAARLLARPDFIDFLRASDHEDASEVGNQLAWWLAWSGHYADALSLYDGLLTRAMSTPRRRQIQARRAYVLGMSSADGATSRLARDAFAELAEELASDRSADERLEFSVLRQHARWVGTSGDPGQALRLLQQLEVDWGAKADRNEREWMLLQSNLAYFLSRSGDVSVEAYKEIAARYRSLAELRERVLGATDPDTLDARRNAVWFGFWSDPVLGLMNARALETDALEILPAGHPYSIAIMLDVAVFAARGSQVSIAQEHLIRIRQDLRSCQDQASALSEYGDAQPIESRFEEIREYMRLADAETDLAVLDELGRILAGGQ